MQPRHVIGLAAFCLLSGSGWLVDSAYPGVLPPIEQQGLHYLVIALVALAFLLLRPRDAAAPRQVPLLPLVAASVLLLGLPALLNESAYTVSARSGVALFALVPLFLVVGAAAFSSPVIGPQPSRTLMMPALIGFAGSALLPSFQLPASARQGLLFSVVFVAVLLTTAGSLWMHTLLHGRGIVLAVAILCGVNALFLAAVALLTDFVVPSAGTLTLELLRSIALDLPQLLLLVWLLRELDPVRFGSRFVFVPLLSVIEGLILLRPPLDLRLSAAVVLMAIGGATLLFWNTAADSETPPSLGLR